MAKLHLGIEVRDFDLERMGFSLSVLDQSGKRQLSESYLRMSLQELGVFSKALKAAGSDIAVKPIEGAVRLPPSELAPLVAAE